MIRTFFAACLISGTMFVLLLGGAAGQQPAEKKPPAKGKFDPPESKKPDEATLKVIAEKTEQLRKAIAELLAKRLRDDVVIEVEIYLKAAENIVRFEEWYHANSGKWALRTLDCTAPLGLGAKSGLESGGFVTNTTHGKPKTAHQHRRSGFRLGGNALHRQSVRGSSIT